MTADGDRQPVIILGAARSGTKLLRRLIAATNCYAEVPYDVNYIWRYGNEHSPHDALSADRVGSRPHRFIRMYLPRLARQSGNSHKPFVEKTVSNILRIPFVRSIYPRAKYVAIIRDGRDVAESAARSWRAPPPARYLLAKARVFPWRHCAPYAWKYVTTFARRRFGMDTCMRTWGPRYPGIDEDLKRLSLIEVCARQWVASMDCFDQARRLFSQRQLFELRYEDLVSDSRQQVHRLCDFLNVVERGEVLAFTETTIRGDRVASQRVLSVNDLHSVQNIAGATLERWGYVRKFARVA
jgi:hypothetical protein